MAGSTTTVYIFSGSKVIAEYQNGAAPSSPTTEYVYAGGALLAKINSSGTFYYHQDHLSNRIVTNSSGAVTAQMGHFPFGESWYNATSDKLFFTTYERDSESGNDYAMARYFENRTGRFATPDRGHTRLDDPQSFNRYTYAANDPCNEEDPLGLSSCTFEIYLNNQVGLSGDQLKQIMARIDSLLSATTDKDGDTVHAELAGPYDANYTIKLTNAAWPFQSPSNWGYTNTLSGSNVYVNDIQAYPTNVPLTTNIGNSATHEFGHAVLGGLFGLGDIPYDPKNPNTMMLDSAKGDTIKAFNDPSSPLWKFSADQIKKLYQDCINKNPPKVPPATQGYGGGGGGHGGGGGGGGSEKPRAFPWLSLPAGLFNALENGGGSTPPGSAWQRCRQQVFMPCMAGAEAEQDRCNAAAATFCAGAAEVCAMVCATGQVELCLPCLSAAAGRCASAKLACGRNFGSDTASCYGKLISCVYKSGP